MTTNIDEVAGARRRTSLGSFLARRPRAGRHGSDGQPLPANTAPAPAPAPLPAPTFTPAARPAAQTRAFRAPAGPAARGAHARTAPARPRQDTDTLERVRDALRDLPAPPLTREQQFTADMRAPRKGGLPVFRAVAHQIGWCGLNEEPAAPVLVPHGAGQWERHGLALIALQDEAARAEIHGILAERERYETRLRAAADAALALGYPGSAL